MMRKMVISNSPQSDFHQISNPLQRLSLADELPDQRLNGARVLLLQDEPGPASALVGVLRQQGCHVMVARSSCQFFEMALQMSPDLIVLHLIGSVIDGPALCAALKTAPSVAAIPVIFITGRLDASARVRSLAAGAVDHIQAPFDWREVLLRMVVHCWGRASGLACQRTRTLMRRRAMG